MPSPNTEFKKGQKYQVVTPFAGNVLTQWRAPFTGGYEKSFPVGLRFVVAFDPPPSATAISADAEPYSDWEKILVDPNDLEDPKYNGYYFVIPFAHVAAYCRRVD